MTPEVVSNHLNNTFEKTFDAQTTCIEEQLSEKLEEIKQKAQKLMLVFSENDFVLPFVLKLPFRILKEVSEWTEQYIESQDCLVLEEIIPVIQGEDQEEITYIMIKFYCS